MRYFRGHHNFARFAGGVVFNECFRDVLSMFPMCRCQAVEDDTDILDIDRSDEEMGVQVYVVGGALTPRHQSQVPTVHSVPTFASFSQATKARLAVR